jgi:chemotaxis signal transduction protein
MTNETNEDPELVSNTETTRKLRLFSRGPRHFGVFEDDVATIVDWREPAPLPHAPESVLGVVGIQGQMLTVLDLAGLADRDAGNETSHDNNPHQILALRGDEQLALAIDVLGETIEIPNQTFDRKPERNGLVLAVFKHGETQISILNVKQLFPSAIQGRERRRRRF